MKRILELQEHIEQNVTVTESGCWTWNGHRMPEPTNYGMISIKNVPRYVHRVQYTLVFGLIPKGLQVLHECDNPPCCNPQHLFLGTQSDNIIDRNSKGRANYKHHQGEDHHFATITEALAIEILKRLSLGARIADLTQEYNLSKHVVPGLAHNKSWKYLPRPEKEVGLW